MPTDPVLASARYLVGESLKELRASVEGLPVEALNWRPASDATNSIAVLATHTVYAPRLWLRRAMGAPLPERDRDSEFRASVDDSAALLRLVDEFSKDCLAVLQSAEEVDWTAMRKTHGRGGDAPPAGSAGVALLPPPQAL